MTYRALGRFGGASAAAALALLAALPAQAQTTPDGRYPVTPQQKLTADQVAQAGVPLSALVANAPDSYTVKSGDTLWGISSLFLTNPWRWPELWGMNREQVRNPHLIYPGQNLRLLKSDGRARLQIGDGLPGGPGDLVKLSPRVRDEGAGDSLAVSSIPNNLIQPFLSQPLVVAAGDLERYPRVVATQEGRVYLGLGDLAYVRGITEGGVDTYNVFRPARPLYDPDDTAHKQPIAYEAHYLGVGRIVRRGEVASLRISESRQEIGVGDRLVPIVRQPMINFVPRRPDKGMNGRIVSVYDGVNQAGSQSIVTLNRGRNDGLEVGHVLALIETGGTVLDKTVATKEYVRLPDERIGEMFVFRVFDTISYALIMRTTHAVQVGDRFSSPDDPNAAVTADAAPAQAIGAASH